jgi:hypothetical protein
MPGHWDIVPQVLGRPNNPRTYDSPEDAGIYRVVSYKVRGALSEKLM